MSRWILHTQLGWVTQAMDPLFGGFCSVLEMLRCDATSDWVFHQERHMEASSLKKQRAAAHPSDADILEAMEKVRAGHKSGHSPKIAVSESFGEMLATN